MFWKIITVIVVCLGLMISFLFTQDPKVAELKLKKEIYEEEIRKRERIISSNQNILVARKQLKVIEASNPKISSLIGFCMKQKTRPDLEDVGVCKKEAYDVLNLPSEYDTRQKALTELEEVPPMPSIK